MWSTFLVATKSSLIEGNGKIVPQKSAMTRKRTEVVDMAHKLRSVTGVFPELTKQGIPVADLQIKEVVKRQSQTNNLVRKYWKPKFYPEFVEEGYERCRKICAGYANSFYLGTLLMTQERQKAIWAIYGKNLYLS